MPSGTASPLFRVRDEVAALKRERTIDVAVELFYARGYENTSLDVIAEHMGVTKPFIYAHFTSKADLLAEICSRGIASALEALNGVLASFGTPTERLTEVCRRFVVAVLHSQRHIAIFAREEKNLTDEALQRINAMRREFDVKLVRLLDDGVAAGEFRIADTRIAALAIGGMVSWAYVWFRDDGRLRPPQIAQEITGLVLGMVDAETAADARPPARARADTAAPAKTAVRRRQPKAKPR